MLYIYNIKLTFCHDMSWFLAEKKPLAYNMHRKKGNRTLYRLYKAIGVELNYQGIGV